MSYVGIWLVVFITFSWMICRLRLYYINEYDRRPHEPKYKLNIHYIKWDWRTNRAELERFLILVIILSMIYTAAIGLIVEIIKSL